MPYNFTETNTTGHSKTKTNTRLIKNFKVKILLNQQIAKIKICFNDFGLLTLHVFKM